MIDMKYNRFDVPQSVADIVNEAVSSGVYDVKDALAAGMCVTDGMSWDDLVTDVSEVAYTWRHHESMRVACSNLNKMVDAHFAAKVNK